MRWITRSRDRVDTDTRFPYRSEQVGELTSTIPGLRSTLEEAVSDEEAEE